MNNRKKVCVYHAGCLDGFTAAYIVKNEMPTTVLVEGRYGEKIDLKEMEGNDIIFVDFSTKREEMLAIAEVARSVLVLDHHASAEKELDGIAEEAENISVVFDMERSGAMIAWDYYFMFDSVPEIVKLVQDRDLWQFKYDRTKAVTAYMYTLPQTMDMWDWLFAADIRDLELRGESILLKIASDVKSILQVASFEAVVDGNVVRVANVPHLLASDSGHAMLEDGKYPFSVTYFIGKDQKYHYSFRANGEYDVSELARKYGGGGHPNAAGAETTEKIWGGEP